MNAELADILTIVGAFGGIEAIKWGANFFANRKTNARIEDAHADAEEFKALREYNEFLQKPNYPKKKNDLSNRPEDCEKFKMNFFL